MRFSFLFWSYQLPLFSRLVQWNFQEGLFEQHDHLIWALPYVLEEVAGFPSSLWLISISVLRETQKNQIQPISPYNWSLSMTNGKLQREQGEKYKLGDKMNPPKCCPISIVVGPTYHCRSLESILFTLKRTVYLKLFPWLCHLMVTILRRPGYLLRNIEGK